MRTIDGLIDEEMMGILNSGVDAAAIEGAMERFKGDSIVGKDVRKYLLINLETYMRIGRYLDKHGVANAEITALNSLEQLDFAMRRFGYIGITAQIMLNSGRINTPDDAVRDCNNYVETLAALRGLSYEPAVVVEKGGKSLLRALAGMFG
ncbi:hypothetical protein HYU12_01640 [Candidatus Woesearchaeota archaeon]|nr:hypothetical protein [Candidatus Woesearchaeota archaeon]